MGVQVGEGDMMEEELNDMVAGIINLIGVIRANQNLDQIKQD